VTSYAVSDISNTFTGLYNNTDYDVRIRSFDLAFVDCSSNYSPYVRVHTDPLNAPTDLSANDITTLSFNVTWKYPYSYYSDISFSIHIKGDGIDDTSTTNDLSKIFFGLTRNTQYDITIKAYDPTSPDNSSVESTLSVRTAIVDDLINLSSNAKTYKSIDVTWEGQAYADTEITYRYILDISGGGKVDTYYPAEPSYGLTNLYDDTDYDIRVCVGHYYTYRYWLGGYLQYGYYPITEFSPPLRVRTDSFKEPIIISANTITTNSFNVAWTFPYSYDHAVLYSLDISGGGTVIDTNALTYRYISFTGLTKNKQYDITIVALDSSMPGYQYNSGPSTFSVRTYLYDAPTNVSSNTITYKSFNVSWTHPSNDPAIHYSLDISANGTVNTYNDISALTYTFTGLSNNTDYDIRVWVYDPSVQSNYSQYLRIRTSTPFGITSAAAEPKLYTYLSSGQLGYLIPPSSPWIGCTFNTIKISGAYGDSSYSALITLNAYIYDGPTKVPSELVSSFNTSPYYTPYTGSDTLDLSKYSHLATTTVYGIGINTPFDITLKFGSTITITNNTIIFVQGVGSSFVSFPTTDLNTYSNTEVQSAAYGPALFDSVIYGSAFFLYNWSATNPTRMLICTLDTT